METAPIKRPAQALESACGTPQIEIQQINPKPLKPPIRIGSNPQIIGLDVNFAKGSGLPVKHFRDEFP
jgi:hypothetical protein